MGEARRRKLLDPNFGKPNLDDLLINSNFTMKGTKIDAEILIGFAFSYVPEEVLKSFTQFSCSVQNEEVPWEVQKNYAPNIPRELIDLDWHPPTKEWIFNFLAYLMIVKKLNKHQAANVLKNMTLAIAAYAINAPVYEDYQ